MCETVVLVAEDEAAIRSLITICLQQQHFTVLPAADGDEALHVVARNNESIDLLITDVQMEGSMNGVELAERLQVERPTLSVLVVSGFPDSLALAAAKGFTALAKPFTLSMLTVRVQEVLAPKVRAKSETTEPKTKRTG